MHASVSTVRLCVCARLATALTRLSVRHLARRVRRNVTRDSASLDRPTRWPVRREPLAYIWHFVHRAVRGGTGNSRAWGSQPM